MSKSEKTTEQHVISTGAISGSRKIYVDGTLHNIKVAMREIILSPTKLTDGKMEHNAPVTVYDTGRCFYG